jgi:hypothetical protein
MADSWVEVAAAALDRLDGQHKRKKRDTVIALVDARLAGRSEETVWDLPQACSRTIYHTKWKHDTVFASVLADVSAIADRWHDTRSLRALQSAAERMALASPVAAARLIALMNNDEAGIVLRAATAILDRAGMETASKGRIGLTGADGGPIPVTEVPPDLSKLGTEELLALKELLAKATVTGKVDEAAQPG